MDGTRGFSARKYRLYPTPAQAERLTGWGHTCRTLWNVALEQRRFAWQQRRRSIRLIEQCRYLTEARAEVPWIADLPSQTGQQVLRHLDRAYGDWLNPGHPAQEPRYHKRNAQLSIFFTNQQSEVRRLSRRWAAVKLPRIGWVRFRMSRALDGMVQFATVKVNGAGDWHVIFGLAVHYETVPPNGKPGCGVDLGVACSAFVSDEDIPRLMQPSLTPGEHRRLLGLQRRKSRQMIYANKHNGGIYSCRLRRTLAAIADLKARQARRRLDFTHKLTTDLAKNHGWVALEDLRVQSMTASAKGIPEKPGRNVKQKAGLNRGILDNTFWERRRQLEYKAPLFGSELRIVSARLTSQRCSACDVVDKASRPGCGRAFACTACGYQDHADRNAALNIKNKARRAAGLNSTRRRIAPSPRETEGRPREPLTSAA